jgi:hypothetical protein
MSLRPDISGFSFAQMQQLFGCKNRVTIESITNEYETSLKQLISGSVQHLRARGREIIKRAILEGIPFLRLNAEDEACVFVADILARHEQKIVSVDLADWQWIAFSDFRDMYGSYLSVSGLELFSFLVDGRPLFGEVIDSGWSYYAYLKAPEVKQLQGELAEFLENHRELKADENMDGFVSELITWLNAINKDKKDLWLLAS